MRQARTLARILLAWSFGSYGVNDLFQQVFQGRQAALESL